MLPTEVEMCFRSFVGAFTADDPLPAGGSAGVASIAVGVGLARKVLTISRGGGDAGEDVGRLCAALSEVAARLEVEFARDCRAFAAVIEALRMPREHDRRTACVREAWCEAVAAPVAVVELAHRARAVLEQCAVHVKRSMRADLAAALDLVACGQRIAVRNARDNAARLEVSDAERLLAPIGREQP